ncbi:hypothetical protein [Sphingomicrobium aestuariivivum]|uniref:hypothetical protein n=1 Tax=Sphingomicrobium aestuariivivum TaxID=1582356 RepID=UPI001FD65076|nr:hypothetical protein [Sphingomicrobium aestuariivivum]MCJ8191403.1 hypothetical protein [Sphingomicrobium aestuariivivum]
MNPLAAILFALIAPPLIALFWDGRRLHRLRQRARAEGVDPAPASVPRYLARAWPAFLTASLGIGLTISLMRSFSAVLPEHAELLLFAPFALAAIRIQHASVRGIEAAMFDRKR